MVTVTITASLLVLHLIYRNLNIFLLSIQCTTSTIKNTYSHAALLFQFLPIFPNTPYLNSHYAIQLQITYPLKALKIFIRILQLFFLVGKRQLFHSYFNDYRHVNCLCFLVIKVRSQRPLFQNLWSSCHHSCYFSSKFSYYLSLCQIQSFLRHGLFSTIKTSKTVANHWFSCFLPCNPLKSS